MSSLKIEVINSLMHYSYNFPLQTNRQLDVILARWPGGVLFKKYIMRLACYRCLKEQIASCLRRKIRPKLEKAAYTHIDLICSGIANDILKQRNMLNMIDGIESLWEKLDSYLNPEEGSSASPSAFWFNYVQEAASGFFSNSLETIRCMDNDSHEKQTMVSAILYGIKRKLPVEYVQEFGEDIDELVKNYFCNPDFQYGKFKAEFSQRVRKKLKPKLANAIKPIVRIAIPHIAKVGAQIIAENTKSLNDWIWSQTISLASSATILTTIFGALSFLYDPSLTISAISLIITAFFTNLGVLSFEFLQTQQVKISRAKIQKNLIDNYGEEFRYATAKCLADFHNKYFACSNEKSAEDFLCGITDGVLETILSEVTRKIVKEMKL